MAFNFMLPLRIAQAVCGLVVLILSAYVANWFDRDTLAYSPSEINFLVFVGIFTLLAIAYLMAAPRFFPAAAHPYAMLAVDAVTMIFFFSGFVALATFLGALYFCRGTVCSAAQADTVFAAIGFVLFAATTALGAVAFVKGKHGSYPAEKSGAPAPAEGGVNMNTV